MLFGTYRALVSESAADTTFGRVGVNAAATALLLATTGVCTRLTRAEESRVGVIIGVKDCRCKSGHGDQ